MSKPLDKQVFNVGDRVLVTRYAGHDHLGYEFVIAAVSKGHYHY